MMLTPLYITKTVHMRLLLDYLYNTTTPLRLYLFGSTTERSFPIVALRVWLDEPNPTNFRVNYITQVLPLSLFFRGRQSSNYGISITQKIC